MIMRNCLNLRTICRIVAISIEIKKLEKELKNLSGSNEEKKNEIMLEIIQLKRERIHLELKKEGLI